MLSACLVSFNQTAAGVATPDAAGIEGIQWQLAEVSGNPVSALAGEQGPFLKFDAVKKQVTGFSGCNNFFGSYEIDGVSLTFGPFGSTRMACPDLQTRLETEIFQSLDKTRTWKIQDGALLLLDGSDVLARFTERGNSGACGFGLAVETDALQ